MSLPLGIIGMVRIPSVEDYSGNNSNFLDVKLEDSKQLCPVFLGWCGWKRKEIVFKQNKKRESPMENCATPFPPK
jgi:hypothetical protein